MFMKNRIARALICLLIIAGLIAGGLTVYAENDESDSIISLIGDIVDYNLKASGCATVRDWIDGTLTGMLGIGSGSEWYVIALSRLGKDYDFSAYADALSAYLSDNPPAGTIARQKYALALIAAGRPDDVFVAETLKNSIGGQGVMSWVFGLHLIYNSAYPYPAKYTAREVIDKILSLVLADGGWAVTGSVSDADVTAMTIQALAPYYRTESDVQAVVDAAVELLSAKQQAGGGFSSYGSSNAESVSQVIIALTSLGLDPLADGRFVKSGGNTLDALLKFRLPGGGFCHTENGEINYSATVQAFCAFVALESFQSGGRPFYCFEIETKPNGDESGEIPDNSEPSVELSPGNESGAVVSSSDSETSPASASDKGSYKLRACAAVVFILMTVCLTLFLRKRRKVKNYFLPVIAAAAAIIFILTSDFQSATGYYGDTLSKTDVIGGVTLTIRCDTIAGERKNEYIPADGVILPVTRFDLSKGETVYDILIEAARKYSIQVENDGVSGLFYITGIGYLYEFDYGDLSGWVYRVNGVDSSVGCGDYTLSDGDFIEWLYTTELGADLD